VRRHTWIIAACAAFITAVVVIAWRRQSATYDGRSLSEWADIYQATDPKDERHQAAAVAIRQMKASAIPLAVALIRGNEPGALKGRLRKLYFRMNARRWAPRWILNPLWYESGDRGAIYFHALGKEGAPAIGDLERIAIAANGSPTAFQAVRALDSIRLEALPALVRIGTNREVAVQTRRLAIACISEFWTNALTVLPTLKQGLTDPELIVRQETTNLFENIAPGTLTNAALTQPSP
jgi:hypothetical protein